MNSRGVSLDHPIRAVANDRRPRRLRARMTSTQTHGPDSLRREGAGTGGKAHERIDASVDRESGISREPAAEQRG